MPRRRRGVGGVTGAEPQQSMTKVMAAVRPTAAAASLIKVCVRVLVCVRACVQWLLTFAKHPLEAAGYRLHPS